MRPGGVDLNLEAQVPDSVRLEGYAETIRTIDDRMSGMMALLDDIRRGVAAPFPSVTITDPRGGFSFGGGVDPLNRALALSKPRIVGNVQLVPPSHPSGDDSVSGWTESEGYDPSFPSLRPPVGGHRGRGKSRRRGSSFRGPPSGPVDVERGGAWDGAPLTLIDFGRPPPPPSGSGPRPPARTPDMIGSMRRPPRTAAVAVRVIGEGPPIGDVLRRAREKVSLEDLGISGSRIRKSATGSLLIEIPGQDCSAKADKLAEKLRSALGSGVAISRPTMQGRIKLTGLDESILPHEIATAVSTLGGCQTADVKVSPVRELRFGTRVAWVHCPLAIAYRVASMGRLTIGWSSVRVEYLGAKISQCYKCWAFRHVRNNCPSSIDRTGSCFRCGECNHQIQNCDRPLRCVLCHDKGLNSDHRMGSRGCESRRPDRLPQPERGNVSRRGTRRSQEILDPAPSEEDNNRLAPMEIEASSLNRNDD